MNQEKTKVYVGCSLAHAPTSFHQQVLALRNSLKEDYEVLEFLGIGAGTDEEVFEHDRECVLKADVVLAICDLPSLGLGYELALAVEKGTPVLAVAHKDAKVSRMILGVTHEGFAFERYDDFSEVKELLREFVEQIGEQ